MDSEELEGGLIAGAESEVSEEGEGGGGGGVRAKGAANFFSDKESREVFQGVRGGEVSGEEETSSGKEAAREGFASARFGGVDAA